MCHCVQLNALFCCLWRKVEASCHKHFVVFSRNQYRRLLPVMCNNLRDGGHPPATVFTPACCSINTGSQARYRLIIAISAYPPAFDAPVSRVPIGILLFGMEKLEWCGYPTVNKFWYFYSFRQNSRLRRTHIHTQTDRQTDTAWLHRPRLHSIARQKSCVSVGY